MMLESKNAYQTKIEQYFDNNENRRLIMGYLHFTPNGIYSDMLPEGIPKLYKDGSSYTVIKSYDDMRGPQGVCSGLDLDEAMKRLIYSVQVNLMCPESMFYYHPEYRENFEKINKIID